ncbi:hypothetical protein F9802_06660 [Bacillus aerolatus]|uniref:SLH domain-containing protein n=1 Tax=Bacillus aerolatus TaxID=2653354 RepID=A0A6I1FKT7_9BACI|nr:S-layer homology domain-containing protein [Bacillus aerolatus]KAB7707428.1 hypothetical protein F9802_06660 [Bacillus aerolatus]
MKKLNKSHLFLTAAATAVAVSSAAPTVDAASEKFFTDVKKGNVLYPEILDLYNQGKINGFTDGTFRPQESVTRGQAAKMVADILELDMKSLKDPGLKDIKKGKWYYEAVAALVQNKVMSGFTDKTFRPDQTLTRAEASRLIGEAFKLKSGVATAVAFKDVKKEKWYYTYVQALVQNEVTFGKTKDSFAPDAKVTRGELVAFASRAKKATEKVKEKSFTVESVKDGIVTINGETYQVSASLKGLFTAKNSAALKGAVIAFESKNGAIEKITSLTLNSSGSASANALLDAGGAVIDGSVSVQGDYYEVKNLTINGDLALTEKVQNSFISEKLTVKGNTRVADQAAAKAASYRAAAENPKTKITIIFKDSTIATIEIAKEDVYFSAMGSTKVTSVSLHANANIFADPDVIIPKVDIKKGVTLVELNVTIKDIIIESNDDIKVTGKGNIENVIINTDKTVTLDTKGQIKNLESKNENSKVTIGDNAKITNITVPEGKKAEDVVQNYDQVKDRVEQVGGTKNPDYKPAEPVTPPNSAGGGGSTTTPGTGGGDSNPTPPGNETEDFFDAGLLSTERFGYVKLNVKNPGAHKVKYLTVNRNNMHEFKKPKVGEQVPANAKEYKADEEFILWSNHEIFMYQVNDKNEIVDLVDINEVWHWYGVDMLVDEEKKTLTIKSLMNPEGKTVQQMFQNVYLFNVDKATKIYDFSDVKWNWIDGIPAVELSYGDDFDPAKLNEFLVEIDWQFSGRLYETIKEGEHTPENYESLDVFMIKYAANEMGDKLGWYLPRAAYEIEEIKREDGSIKENHRNITEQDSISMKRYREEVIKQQDSLNTRADISKLVAAVNVELKDKVDAYKKAREAVDGLYKEDWYDYEESEERLKEGLTQEEIDAARALVQSLSSEFTEKEHLEYRVDYADYLFNKKAAEEFIGQVKKEVEITDPTIGLSISDLLYKEKSENLKVKVSDLGNEMQKGEDYSYVTGAAKYLSVDASGKLILNRLNTSGESIKEYAVINVGVGNYYVGNEIVAVVIPTSTSADTTSSETKFHPKVDNSYIRYIDHYPVNRTIRLKSGVSVDQLMESIQSADSSVQSYQVQSADGKVKGSGIIEHGDRLIVTAENGQSKGIYKIQVPVVIQNLKTTGLGKLTFEAENTNIKELNTLLHMLKRVSGSNIGHDVEFILKEEKDENGNIIPNRYEVTIPEAIKDVFYDIYSTNNRVDFENSRPSQIIWRSFQVVDAEANPDTEAKITGLEDLKITSENIRVRLQDYGNWSETVTIDGVTISSEVKEENGEWKIHFKSEGTDKGEINAYRILGVRVKAEEVENEYSIVIEVDSEGNISVRSVR